jgi:hypothetical protein
MMEMIDVRQQKISWNPSGAPIGVEEMLHGASKGSATQQRIARTRGKNLDLFVGERRGGRRAARCQVREKVNMRGFAYNYEWYQRLSAAGCPVSPLKKSGQLAEMFPATSRGESEIHEDGHLGVLYCAYLVILAHTSFRLGGFELDAPFPSDPELLVPTKQKCLKSKWKTKHPVYQYEIWGNHCLPYNDVLNHHFEQHQRLQPGDRLQGALLLHYAGYTIPQDFPQHQQTTISLHDTSGEVVACCPVDFLVIARPKAKAVLPQNWQGSSLFSDEAESGRLSPYEEGAVISPDPGWRPPDV